MDASTSSADRTLILGYCNDAYQQSVLDSECLTGNFSRTLPGGTDQVNLVTILGAPTGGTFTVSVDDTGSNIQTTATNAFDISAATLETNIEALSNVVPADVAVTRSGNGTAASPYVYRIVWAAALAATRMTVTANGASLTGGTNARATTSTTVEGFSYPTDGFFPPDILYLKNLTITSGGNTRPLVATDQASIMEMRRSTTQVGQSIYYAMPSPSEFLLYPSPGADTIKGSYVRAPLELVESSPTISVSELIPTAYPAAFHYKVIVPKALEIAAEYKQQGDAGYYAALYDRAVDDLRSWVNRFQGEQSSVIGLDRLNRRSAPDVY